MTIRGLPDQDKDVEYKINRGYCEICRFWRLTSTASQGIARSQCAYTARKKFFFFGPWVRKGRTCVQFKIPESGQCSAFDLWCGRFKKI